MNIKLFIILISIGFLNSSCKKDTEADLSNPYTPTPYTVLQPSHFPEHKISENNKLTVEGVALGRRLYYDPMLSNNGLSCSSCHLQSKGFTNGAVNGTTILPHINLGWNSNFLWDGKIKGTMEDIMFFEVHDFFQADMSKFNQDPTYKELFKKAFNVNTITAKDAAFALSQFFHVLNSSDSKFDKFLTHQGSLTASELRGFVIFNTEKGDCFHCHSIPLMTNNEFHNIGLDSVHTGKGLGAYLVTGNSNDIGKFKTATLRNAALRDRFMHDGRFSTLEEVVEHYNSGVKMNSQNLDPLMTKPGKEFGLDLSVQEKVDLVNFLKTMTDTTFTNNPNLSNPF